MTDFIGEQLRFDFDVLWPPLHNRCDYLLPHREVGIVNLFDEALPECLLHKGHKGEHLVLTSQGLFFWETDEDSEFVEGSLEHDAYLYREAPPQEALEHLLESSRVIQTSLAIIES